MYTRMGTKNFHFQVSILLRNTFIHVQKGGSADEGGTSSGPTSFTDSRHCEPLLTQHWYDNAKCSGSQYRHFGNSEF